MTAHNNEPYMQIWFHLTFTIYPDSITIFLIVIIFRYFSFEVCFVTIIKVMSWWWYVKLGLNPLVCWLKLEWRSWRQELEAPNWSTNVRSNGGRSDPLLTKTHRQKKTAILKTVHCNNHLNWYPSFVIIKTLSKFRCLYHHSLYVIINVPLLMQFSY